MIFRAKAPLRIGFCGGGSDVPPFVNEYGGYVLNATINKYVHVTLETNDSGRFMCHSNDFHQSVEYDIKSPLPYDGNLDLIKACFNKVHGYIEIKGCDIYIQSDAPPGVGLGTSSTVVVAVLGALLEASKLNLNCYEIARMAYDVERNDLGMLGGGQDQYAATFGGINFIEFHKDGSVIVNTLRLTKKTINELQHNLLLCYTGIRHNSHDIIREQREVTKERIDILTHLKEIASAMKEDLLTDELSNFGQLLSYGWQRKKCLSDKISNAHIDSIAQKAMDAGAEGLKITGAGGGGVFIVYCDWRKKTLIANVMSQAGCQILDFTITKTGLESWFVE